MTPGLAYGPYRQRKSLGAGKEVSRYCRAAQQALRGGTGRRTEGAGPGLGPVSDMEAVSNLQDFVMMESGRIVTDSLKVAQHFGKRHKNVLRAFDRMDCSREFNRLNFEPVEYTDTKGELRRAVKMTKDGFMFLVMGFTGRAAAQMKEAFIAAFNAMADHIRAGALNAIQEFHLLAKRRAAFERGAAAIRTAAEHPTQTPETSIHR